MSTPRETRPAGQPAARTEGAGQPATAAPAGAEPGAAKPGDAKPGDAKPGDAKPGDAKPGDAKSGAAKPSAAKPGAAKPGAAESSAAKPGAAKAGAAKPTAAKPAGAGPAGAGPAAAKSSAAEPAAGRSGAPARSGTARPAGRSPAGAAPAGTGTVVVGAVPVLTRVAGGLGLVGALCRLVAPALPLAEVDGTGVGAAANLADWLVVLPLVAVVGAAGLVCLLGRLPRFGLAVLLSAGTVQVGLLLRALYLLDSADRSTLDLPLGIATSVRYDPAAGLTLLLVSAALLAAAALAGAVAWAGTVMEDHGALDRLRPRLGAVGLVLGAVGAIALGMSPYDSAVPGLTPPPLPERDGLDLLGGVVATLAVAGWAVVAATLRPRLATVGGYLGLVAVLATDGLAASLLVIRSPALDATGGTVTLLLAAAGFGLLALAAWRLRGSTAET